MTAVDLPIEELRQRLAQISLQGTSAAGPDMGHRELVGFVPPCTDARDATLESKLSSMHEPVRLRDWHRPRSMQRRRTSSCWGCC
jgi:hypothetical protein